MGYWGEETKYLKFDNVIYTNNTVTEDTLEHNFWLIAVAKTRSRQISESSTWIRFVTYSYSTNINRKGLCLGLVRISTLANKQLTRTSSSSTLVSDITDPTANLSSIALRSFADKHYYSGADLNWNRFYFTTIKKNNNSKKCLYVCLFGSVFITRSSAYKYQWRIFGKSLIQHYIITRFPGKKSISVKLRRTIGLKEVL